MKLLSPLNFLILTHFKKLCRARLRFNRLLNNGIIDRIILPILTFHGIKRMRDIFNKPDYQYFVKMFSDKPMWLNVLILKYQLKSFIFYEICIIKIRTYLIGQLHFIIFLDSIERYLVIYPSHK